LHTTMRSRIIATVSTRCCCSYRNQSCWAWHSAIEAQQPGAQKLSCECLLLLLLQEAQPLGEVQCNEAQQPGARHNACQNGDVLPHREPAQQREHGLSVVLIVVLPLRELVAHC
jgi:hypothetical protein